MYIYNIWLDDFNIKYMIKKTMFLQNIISTYHLVYNDYVDII